MCLKCSFHAVGQLLYEYTCNEQKNENSDDILRFSFSFVSAVDVGHRNCEKSVPIRDYVDTLPDQQCHKICHTHSEKVSKKVIFYARHVEQEDIHVNNSPERMHH